MTNFPMAFTIADRLVGDGLLIREWRLDSDLDTVVEAYLDPAIRQSAPPDTELPDTPERAASYILGSYDEHSQGTALRLAICEIDDERVVGGIDFEIPPDMPDQLEVGYWVLAAERGQGVAGRALIPVFDWLVDARPNTRVWAEVQAGNEASLVTLRRLGFCEPGVHRMPANLPEQPTGLVLQRALVPSPD